MNVELNDYRPLKRRQHGGDICDGCGKCNEVCPVQLDVVRELKHASEFQDEHSFWSKDGGYIEIKHGQNDLSGRLNIFYISVCLIQ